MIGITICAIGAWLTGTYYYLAYQREFARQRAMGGIPPPLIKGQRVGLSWMIASGGIVPKGEPHRKRSTVAMGVFVLCFIAMAIAASL